MLWLYQEYYGIEPDFHLEMIPEEFNDPGTLAELYPNVIYFYAELTPIED